MCKKYKVNMFSFHHLISVMKTSYNKSIHNVIMTQAVSGLYECFRGFTRCCVPLVRFPQVSYIYKYTSTRFILDDRE